MLVEQNRLKDGSVVYGKGIIGPSTADTQLFNSLHELPKETRPTAAKLDAGNPLERVAQYLAVIGGKIKGPEALLVTVLVTGACGGITNPFERTAASPATAAATAEPGTEGATATSNPNASPSRTPNASPSAKPSGTPVTPGQGPAATEGPKPTSGATTTATAQETAGPRLTSEIKPAVKVSENVFRLNHPDGDKTIDVSLPPGFTPDSRLYLNTDTRALPLGDLSQYSTAEKAHISDGTPDGVGYNYDYNDYCEVPGFECNQQWDMFAWRVDQGEVVRVPGVGELRGGPRRSVLLVVINLDNHVKAHDIEKNGPVYVKHGFTATGRIFDGNNAQRNERNLTGHWLWKQGHGDASKSYVGITDSPDNALETLVITVIRKQWGNNPDGSPRVEDQLLRAEIVKVQ